MTFIQTCLDSLWVKTADNARFLNLLNHGLILQKVVPGKAPPNEQYIARTGASARLLHGWHGELDTFPDTGGGPTLSDGFTTGVEPH